MRGERRMREAGSAERNEDEREYKEKEKKGRR
jgi:hypothetical protein